VKQKSLKKKRQKRKERSNLKRGNAADYDKAIFYHLDQMQAFVASLHSSISNQIMLLSQ
jgi:hypothetical protein